MRNAQFFLRGQWVASYYGKGKRARGRAATCPCEETIRAQGEDSLSLGTHDAQTSCLLPKLSHDGILLKVGMGGFICVPYALSFIPQTTESLGLLYMFTLESVADPRLFDPRVCDYKTYITTLGMQQTFAHDMSGWENRTWWFLSSSSGFTPWPQWNEGVSSRIIFESSGSLKQKQRPFFAFWYLYCGNYYLNGTPALRSLIYVDVGEPTLHPCSMTEMMQDHHLLLLETLSHLGHLFERLLLHREEVLSGLGFLISESVVSHLFFWVSSCVVLFLFLVGFVLFVTGRHLAFCSHLFSNMWE